jgi:hypothetical protein
VNQYSITWGSKNLRNAIAARLATLTGMTFDPEAENTVCCGSTEGMIASLLATINPEDEIIIFEPFYENYNPDAILSGATRRYVSLHPPDWNFDPAELESAFNSRTKAIIINTEQPHRQVFAGRAAAIAFCQVELPGDHRRDLRHILTTAPSTSACSLSTECESARSPSTASRRRSVSPAGVSATW